MHAREVWFGRSPGAKAARAALTPLSWLYAAGWQGYLALYRAGWKRAEEPHRPVLCVGNLMIGGTGKSPMTLYLAQLLGEMGKQVVVSASGYGSPKAEAASLAPEGTLDPGEWGDEPAMLRWLLPEVPLIVGRRRILAAELCHRHFPDAVLLMDDGFQHLPLKKHVTILLDPEDPPNTKCLPAGPYREPRRNRKRADLVLPGRFSITEAELTFEDPSGGIPEELPKEYSVLCALGQPDRFLKSLAGEPRATMLLADHDPMTTGNLFDLLPREVPTVVTAKDWVKLRNRPDLEGRRFLVAKQSVRVDPEERFREWLKEKLDESQTA
jgi:tetraacyldisaccharide 4'-kinase